MPVRGNYNPKSEEIYDLHLRGYTNGQIGLRYGYSLGKVSGLITRHRERLRRAEG